MNKIICGDSAIMLLTLEPESIDLTVTSPPYDNLRAYNGYTFDFEKIACGLYRVTKPGGVVVWVVGDATIDGSETLTSFRHAIYFRSLGFNVETMIYEVDGTGAKGSNYYYWQSFEYMFILSKGQPKTSNRLRDKINSKAGHKMGTSPKNERLGTRIAGANGSKVIADRGYRGNVWQYHPGVNGDDKTDHPAPFPEQLANDHILSWSNPGDIVLDPFAGSGTTLKKAKELGRHYIGIEISPDYCKIAEKRVAAANVPLPFFSVPSPSEV